MAKFAKKTGIVTGGASGIGLATAKLFVAEGGRVLVTGRSQKALDAAKLELGENATVLASDTALVEEIDALADEAKRTLGEVDFLFVNAAIAKFAPLEAVTPSAFGETFAINTRGAFSRSRSSLRCSVRAARSS